MTPTSQHSVPFPRRTPTPPRRLRDRLLTVAGFGALAAVVVLVVLATTTMQMRRELATGSNSVAEEQRIADQVVSGVLRQLTTVTMAADRDPAEVRRDFERAGLPVHAGLRAYLFRQLSAPERLQIERVKEKHQLLEVAALRVARLASSSGDATQAASLEASRELQAHTSALLGEIDGFVRMRETDLQALLRGQDEAFRRLLLLGGGLLLLTAVLTSAALLRFVRRRVTLPLDHLATAVSRLGAGETGVTVDGEHDLEFLAVAANFNAMADSLTDARSALEQRNAELELALTQVRAAQDDLVQAEKLGALGRMTAGLAHELNNPLASVLGFSQLLATDLAERGEIAPEELTTRYVAPLTREAMRAHQLVRSLLHFSRRAGTEIGPVSLRRAMEVVVDLRHFAFGQAGLQLTVGTIPDVAVRAEQQRLQGILLNLINNAYDAMAPRKAGELRISGEVVGDQVELRFEDDGPGMASPEHVFEPFYTTKSVGEGTGLGLALVKRFVEAFGGSIRARNVPGHGARFDVALVVDPSEVERVEDATPTLPRHTPGTRRHVLVVEDEVHLRRLAMQVLPRLGVEVHLAGSAAEARTILDSQPIDVVVSDVMMPGESGMMLYRWVLHRHPELADRFLFVTGDVHAEILGGLADRIPHAFLQKPYDLREYLGRVQSLLQQ